MSGTLDRDVRLSPGQIATLADAVRRRKNQVAKSISTAEANRAAGQKIQHGTLDWHYKELRELNQCAEILEVARQQIVHKMKHQLGLEEGAA